LQIGLAASAWPLATWSPLAEGGVLGARPTNDTVPIYKVLYDLRFPASVAFAHRAAARGVTAQSMAGDMTRFWYDDLYHRWQQGPAAIAGLTAHGALFCLERLAWDQRMRVVVRAEHQLTAAGGVTHEITAPSPLLPIACRAVAKPDWAAAMADLITQCPNGRAEIGAAQAVTMGDPIVLPPESEPLFSWVIAPAGRA
jgi:hypothetical protein